MAAQVENGAPWADDRPTAAPSSKHAERKPASIALGSGLSGTMGKVTLGEGMSPKFRKVVGWAIAIVAIGILPLLIVSLYFEENWRGARDWAACQRELEAEGETLDINKLLPPRDSKNDLSKVPIFAEWYQEEKTGSRGGRLDEISTSFQSSVSNARTRGRYLGDRRSISMPQFVDQHHPAPVDLVAWQAYYQSTSVGPYLSNEIEMQIAAQDILKTLSRFDSDLNEIEVAVNNSNGYWSVKNKDGYIMIPYSGCENITQVLQLRGVAHLACHETEKAKEDFLFSLQLARCANNSSAMGSSLTIWMYSLNEGILWEGIRRHAWNREQLREIEEALNQKNFLSDYCRSLREARADLAAMDLLTREDLFNSGYKNTKLFWMISNGLSELWEYPKSWIWHFQIILCNWRPQGWLVEDKCNFSFGIEKRIKAIDLKEGILDLTIYDCAEDIRNLEDDKKALVTPLTVLCLYGVDGELRRYIEAESYLRMARLVCRLEEYRIDHGRYPEKLEELSDLPPHLNQEVFAEQPLHYQRKGDSYLLYSVGWNQKDDGGTRSDDQKEADWVWPSP